MTTALTDATRLDEPVSEQQAEVDPRAKLVEWSDNVNIAEELPDDVLSKLGELVYREYEVDVRSRNDWSEHSEKAMKLAMQVAEVKQYPWPRASNVIYPLMTTAAIQFAARAYPAIISGRNVVRGMVVGDDTGVFQVMPPTPGMPPPPPQVVVPPGAKATRAQKIGEHMSWQLLDEQTEWEEETDKLLHILPIVGCCFRKSYFDPAKGRNVSCLVSAKNLVLNYHAKSMETAPRITEEVVLYPLEIIEKERAGVFRKVQYVQTGTTGEDDDAPQMFLEQHRWYDLDDDGYPEPYIVTIVKETRAVVRIVARFDHEGIEIGNEGQIVKINDLQYYTKYDFLPNPEGGIYGIGFGQLLRPINEATNTTLNMLIDAGHLANTGGGFIGKGLSMHTGMVRFVPGEYKTVNVSGSTVRENIVPLTFPGPSTVLFQLLGTLVEAGKEIAAVKDVLTGEQKNANVPATTTLALIEQGLKVFTAIYKRIHRALKKELEKLYRLNGVYLPDNAGYQVQGEWHNISRDDYKMGNGVEPVSDPSMVSDMQKLGRAQFLMQFAADPMFNGLAIRKRILDAAMIEKPEELLVEEPPPNPEVIKMQQELQTRAGRAAAENAKDYAQAILALAQAKKVGEEVDFMWYEHQLEIFKAKLEEMNVKSTPTDDKGTKPSEDNIEGGLPSLEAPSGQSSDLALPPGLSGGPPAGIMGLPQGNPGNVGP